MENLCKLFHADMMYKKTGCTIISDKVNFSREKTISNAESVNYSGRH